MRWELVQKKRHIALLVEGRQVLILARTPQNGHSACGVHNARAALRRHLRALVPA